MKKDSDSKALSLEELFNELGIRSVVLGEPYGGYGTDWTESTTGSLDDDVRDLALYGAKVTLRHFPSERIRGVLKHPNVARGDDHYTIKAVTLDRDGAFVLTIEHRKKDAPDAPYEVSELTVLEFRRWLRRPTHPLVVLLCRVFRFLWS